MAKPQEKPLGPYFRLLYSWDMILCLEDFINCINIHKTDLRSPRNKTLMVFFGNQFNPAGVLKDYIYLEANSFFQYAKKCKNKGDKNMPNLPSYLEELKEFRDVLIGHRDFKEKFKSYEDFTRLHENISKLIPIKSLIKDIDSYYQEVKRRYWSSQSN